MHFDQDLADVFVLHKIGIAAPLTTFAIDFEQIDDTTFVSKAFHDCLQIREGFLRRILRSLVPPLVEMHVPLRVDARAVKITREIEDVNFAFGSSDVVVHGVFKRVIAVAADGVDEVTVLFWIVCCCSWLRG